MQGIYDKCEKILFATVDVLQKRSDIPNGERNIQYYFRHSKVYAGLTIITLPESIVNILFLSTSLPKVIKGAPYHYYVGSSYITNSLSTIDHRNLYMQLSKKGVMLTNWMEQFTLWTHTTLQWSI